MSFSEKILQPQSHPIVLFEYDLPVNNDVLINYEAGIWYNILTPGNVTFTDDYGNVWYYPNTNEIEYNIQSLKIGSKNYTKVTSLADLRIQDASFYYNSATTKIYIHFEDWEPPLAKIILLGSVTGFSTEADRVDGAFYENVYYDPRIQNIPALNIKKDPLFFGKIAFNSGSVSMANNDGFFDNFDDQNAFRQAARFLLGFEGEPYSEYQKVFSGYLENYSRDFENFTVTIQDLRKSLSRPIPDNYFTVAEYPNMDPDNEDYPKPLAYGQVRKAPVICINEDETTPTNYEFLLADTTYHDIDSVVAIFELDENITSTATWSVDTTTGILSIAEADVGDPLDVSVTFNGFVDDDGDLITNAMDVIQDLMFYYGDIAFIDTNFNLTNWNIAKADSRDIGIFIDDETEIIDAIGEIINSTNGIFFTQLDGKYTAKIFDEDREPAKTIENYEWIGNPKIKNNGSEFLSSVQILYNKDLKDDKYLKYLNARKQSEALALYKSYQQKDFETLLYTEADALALSDLIMEQSYTVRDVVTRKVKMQHYGLEIGDFVIANPTTRPSGDITDFGVWEVIGKQINLNNFEITLTLKYIKEYTESTTVYTQGWGLANFGFGTFGHGATRFDEV